MSRLSTVYHLDDHSKFFIACGHHLEREELHPLVNSYIRNAFRDTEFDIETLRRFFTDDKNIRELILMDNSYDHYYYKTEFTDGDDCFFLKITIREDGDESWNLITTEECINYAKTRFIEMPNNDWMNRWIKRTLEKEQR